MKDVRERVDMSNVNTHVVSGSIDAIIREGDWGANHVSHYIMANGMQVFYSWTDYTDEKYEGLFTTVSVNLVDNEIVTHACYFETSSKDVSDVIEGIDHNDLINRLFQDPKEYGVFPPPLITRGV